MEEENKIYIGNLDYSITEDELNKLLEEKGIQTTEMKIITDKFTGRSKGFGFAEFENNEDAKNAILSLDGHELKGRKLRVNKARRQSPRFGR
jgi:RNA recognition motif-containing protein